MITLTVIDWKQVLLGEEPLDFLIEVALRTTIMYIGILLALKALGKRGVKQLSIFELVIIIGFGSAAGDPMFYKDVGILNAIVVFLVVILLYKATTYLVTRSERIDRIIEGEPICLVWQGTFSIANFDKETLGYDEFFSEMRQQSVSHLGQIEQAIIEVSGNISLFYYEDKDVKYGLPILPKLYAERYVQILTQGIYSCSFCGHTQEIQPTDKHLCPTCNKQEWVTSINRPRIT
ncbi:MAG: hypothetical protein CFE23_11720 [Flavobacterium sp. BFFFF1]|uniref:DUF421 domain-containing protein n=1 Tax=Flavobacterium sp. BFFFF1 TaxID=2015557 RepID=UPI000BD2E463|nr:YetF domain-containing protein [Flavobacterium sp. BFFFF1]OYU79917.1 MAG: hypothetical protein CFE23_11720 [Flavobacterium sp. BFFFF1]